MNLALWLSLCLALASGVLFLTSLPATTALQLAPAAALSALAGVEAAPLLRALQARWPRTRSVQATQSARDDGHMPVRAATTAPAAAAPEPPPTPAATDLERLLERIGERYLADLRELHDAFARLYLPQLADKAVEITALRTRLGQLERERDQLRQQVEEQEQQRLQLVADVQTMRDELSGRLAAVVQTLVHDTRADLPGECRAGVVARPTTPDAPATSPSSASDAPSRQPIRPSAPSTRRHRR